MIRHDLDTAKKFLIEEHNKGELNKSLDAFRRAVLIRPDFWEAYDHMGHVLRTQGKLTEARDAFEHAIAIDPKAASAHHNLATILIMQGDLQGGINALEKAHEVRPRHIPTLLNLGIALHTDGRLNTAVEIYRKAIEIEPSDPSLHLNLGLVYVEQRRSDEAEHCFLEALKLDAGMVLAHAELAALYEETNRLDELEKVLAKGIKLSPDHPRLNLEAAKADRRAGRLQEGLDRLSRFDLDDLDPRLAEQFQYQLGYLHDRAGESDAAFENFCIANRLASANARALKAEPEKYLEMLDRLFDYFVSTDVADWTPTPSLSRQSPVFLLGFPRSGTTLLDVALDNHPDIRTVEEQQAILPILERLSNRSQGFPASLTSLSQSDIEALRTLYFEVIDGHARPEPGQVVIDKAPIRTAYAGILWRLFPEARFLFCLRHPCDVILSNFMQHYTVSDAYANFFTMKGSVAIYDKVMKLWQIYVSKLPLKLHTVRYETLVDDLESELRRILEFLSLPWDPKVLEYADRARRRGMVNTNSYHQVSEPIFTRSRGRWRLYQHYFEPHMSVLASHLDYFEYDS